MEDNSNDENSKIEDNDKQHEEPFIDDTNLSVVRRSSRPRKAPTIEVTSVISSKTVSQEMIFILNGRNNNQQLY
ncbi:unnamed protein product [Rotaria sordida]|uniref:Uncharacterized protein n=1 Tax=Rotaria sordida TaxID=392033 RepID=A0A819QMV1_9BILA|nr:unnamed protein product [Rotaria sordida]